MPLSRDHTAEREDERQRIVQAGGQVSHVMGSWRIGQAGIQVSRCKPYPGIIQQKLYKLHLLWWYMMVGKFSVMI